MNTRQLATVARRDGCVRRPGGLQRGRTSSRWLCRYSGGIRLMWATVKRFHEHMARARSCRAGGVIDWPRLTRRSRSHVLTRGRSERGVRCLRPPGSGCGTTQMCVCWVAAAKQAVGFVAAAAAVGCHMCHADPTPSWPRGLLRHSYCRVPSADAGVRLRLHMRGWRATELHAAVLWALG